MLEIKVLYSLMKPTELTGRLQREPLREIKSRRDERSRMDMSDRAASEAEQSRAERAMTTASCIFCQIVRSETFTKLLHSDEKFVAFLHINRSAYSSDGQVELQDVSFGNIGIKNKCSDSWQCVLIAATHVLTVGQTILHRDAQQSK